MNTDGKEKKTQNRELVGESIEIIGDQALCQCVNGSVQVPLKVTSQQKFYCNSASRLIATNGDNDGRSLNFGSCKARNNSPCMPMILWKHYYDKILLGNTLFPLTMRSEGVCVFGGTVSIVTSGQQVLVNPPCSGGEARRMVHSNPLFNEEDMKGKAGVKPQRNDAPVERHPSKASVTSVRVNGKTYVSPRAHDEGPLVFTNTLTSGASDPVAVKWDVTCNGRDVATGLSAPPPRELFAKEGEYKVFAYVKDRGSKEGGGYVTVDVSYPTFVSLGWEDTNGEAVHLVGKRYAAYANLKFKGMGDIPVKARFYFLGGNGKHYLTDYVPLAIGQDGRARLKLVLTDCQVKGIKDERQAWHMKVLIRVELASGEWVDGLKRSEGYVIEYTDKKDIASTTLYRDRDCHEEVTGFVECGQTVYARIITRGFKDGLLTLSVFCHGTIPDDNSAATGYVFKAMGEVDNDGVCIQEMVTEQSWLQGKHSETFDILVIGGCFREEMNNTPSDRENYSTRNACKTFQMGKDKVILLLCLPKQEIEDGQSKTMVQNVNGDGDGCPRCREEWADLLARLRQVFPKVSAKRLETVAKAYAKHMGKLGMDSCWVKAHFFAQVAIETGYTLNISEDMRYSRARLEDIFPSSIFKGEWKIDKRTKRRRWVSEVDKTTKKRIYKPGMKETLDRVYSINASSERQKVIANFVYANNNGNGDYHSGDGWRYRGSGLVQLTGKEVYRNVQRVMTTLLGVKADILTNGADTINANDEIAAIASMCYLYLRLKKKPNEYCNGNSNAVEVSEIVGNNVTNPNGKSNWELKQDVFNKETSQAFQISLCVCPQKKEKKPEIKWHDPLDNPHIALYTQSGKNNFENQVFGLTRGRPHQGLDLFALEGTKLYACLAGKVVVTRNKHQKGLRYVVIEVSDEEQLKIFRSMRRAYKPCCGKEYYQGPGFNPNSKKMYFVYYHMSEITVNQGQMVSAGDVIGLSGITGIKDGTCGPHLHFEIKSKNTFNDGLANRVNPGLYLDFKREEENMSDEMKAIQLERKKKGQLKAK